MAFHPRSIFLASALVATAAFTAQTVAAETVKVPFSFKVRDTVLPAGVYTVQRNNLSNVVTLKGPQTNQNFSWTLEPGSAAPNAGDVKVSFTQRGSEYSLHEIQYHALTTSKIDKGRTKAEIERTLRGE